MHFTLHLFDVKNTAALKEFREAEAPGTDIFLQQAVSWWNIVIVITPFKGITLRQEKSIPIDQNSSHDPNLLFLAKFCEWRDAWEGVNYTENEGQVRKQPKETHFALRHITSTLILIV